MTSPASADVTLPFNYQSKYRSKARANVVPVPSDFVPALNSACCIEVAAGQLPAESVPTILLLSVVFGVPIIFIALLQVLAKCGCSFVAPLRFD